MIQHFPMFSVEITREEIPVDTMSPRQVPDPQWRVTDKQGHGHFWEGSELPTLEWVVVGSCWVGDEIDGTEVKVGEWRCKHCAEVIYPKKTAEYGPRSIPGPTRIVVTIEGDQFSLSEMAYAEAIGALHDHLRCMRGDVRGEGVRLLGVKLDRGKND